MGKTKSNNRFLSNPNLSTKEYIELLYELHFDYVKGIVNTIIYDTTNTCDVTQDAFLRAWINVEKVRTHPKPHRWLVRTAKNIMAKSYHAEKRRNGAEVNRSEMQPNDLSQPQDEGESLTYEKLSKKDFEIIVLFYEEKMSIKEIAGSLSITENTAKKRLSRARLRYEALAIEDGKVKKTKKINLFLLMCLVSTLFGY